MRIGERLVVGLYQTKGEAENAGHRVVSEGAGEDDVEIRVLSSKAPPPATMEPELDTLSLDPYFWFLGDLKDDYANEITNGETAVCVAVDSPEAAESVANVLMMFEPKRIDVIVSEPPASPAI